MRVTSLGIFIENEECVKENKAGVIQLLNTSNPFTTIFKACVCVI